ncbi:MAG: desulfoferrodoxin [bacterium]|nr:desulfoferrodoxin [bacterium]
MIERLQTYKCSVCGNIVEVLHVGGGILVCCGKPMELLKEKTEDVGKEKHIPVIEKSENTINVKVGAIPHPMEEKHYIEWVELITGEGTLLKFLKPSDKPEVEFEVKSATVWARVYCNVHGFWKSV